MLAFLGAGTYRLIAIIFATQQYTFAFDSFLSPSVQELIKTTVRKNNVQSFSCIAQCIKQEHPCIENLSIEQRTNKSIHVCLQSFSPLFCLNKNAVLLKNGCVVSYNNYSSNVLEKLPNITHVSPQGEYCATGPSPAFKKWLLQFPRSLLSHYAIQWADDYEIYLIDQNKLYKTIVCSVLNAINEGMIEKCQCIIREKNMNAQGTAPSIFYTADIRFEKQIIICSQRGGAYHG